MIKLRRLRFAVNFIEMVTREVNFDERKPCHINTNASSLEESLSVVF